MKRTIEELRTALGDNTGRYPAWVLLSRWIRYRQGRVIEVEGGDYHVAKPLGMTVSEHNAALSSVTPEESALVFAHAELVAAEAANAKCEAAHAKATARLETARAEFEKLNES